MCCSTPKHRPARPANLCADLKSFSVLPCPCFKTRSINAQKKVIERARVEEQESFERARENAGEQDTNGKQPFCIKTLLAWRPKYRKSSVSVAAVSHILHQGYKKRPPEAVIAFPGIRQGNRGQPWMTPRVTVPRN